MLSVFIGEEGFFIGERALFRGEDFDFDEVLLGELADGDGAAEVFFLA